jgi:2-dehydropantoate 2-reductase
MKHAVLGLGAIGGLMGVALEFIGEQVTLVVRPEKLPNYPRQLTLEQPTRTISAAARPVSKLTEAVDVLWIATKTYQLQAALAGVETIPRMVVPLLNGVDHVAMLRSHFGDERVVPATIAVGADRPEEGHFVQGSPVRLNVAGSGEKLLGTVLASLQEQLGFLCRFEQNEQTLLWTKLCFLAPFALVTTASGKDKGRVLADAGWKSALYSAISEATSVAKAEGAEIDTSAIQAILDSSPPTMRSSMLKDFIAGRRLELDGIAGPIVRGGDKHGIPVPTTKKLMKTISSKVDTRQD